MVTQCLVQHNAKKVECTIASCQGEILDHALWMSVPHEWIFLYYHFMMNYGIKYRAINWKASVMLI